MWPQGPTSRRWAPRALGPPSAFTPSKPASVPSRKMSYQEPKWSMGASTAWKPRRTLISHQ